MRLWSWRSFVVMAFLRLAVSTIRDSLPRERTDQEAEWPTGRPDAADDFDG